MQSLILQVYMATCLLVDKPFQKIENPEQFKSEVLTREELLRLKIVRRTNLAGYGYLVQADRLLAEKR